MSSKSGPLDKLRLRSWQQAAWQTEKTESKLAELGFSSLL